MWLPARCKRSRRSRIPPEPRQWRARHSAIGLINENEFYSDHYLAEIFAGDIHGVLEIWRGKDSESRERHRDQA